MLDFFNPFGWILSGLVIGVSGIFLGSFSGDMPTKYQQRPWRLGRLPYELAGGAGCIMLPLGSLMMLIGIIRFLLGLL